MPLPIFAAGIAQSSDCAHPLYKFRSSRGCLEHIALAMERSYIPRGQTIVQHISAERRRKVPTQIEAALHIIDRGEVIVTEVRPNGFSESRTLKERDFFGERTLSDHYHNPQLYCGESFIWQAVAKHDAICWSLTREDLDLLGPSLEKLHFKEYYRVCRSCEIFNNLDDETVGLLKSRMQVRTYEDCQHIVTQGEAMTEDSEFFIILCGKVEVVRLNEAGTTTYFGPERGGVNGRLYRGHGAYVGEAQLRDDGPRSASLVAHGSTEVLALSYRDLLDALQSSNKSIADLVMVHYEDATIASRNDGFDASQCLESACTELHCHCQLWHVYRTVIESDVVVRCYCVGLPACNALFAQVRTTLCWCATGSMMISG